MQASAYAGPDGKLDLKEFGWYLADIACGFGETKEVRRRVRSRVQVRCR